MDAVRCQRPAQLPGERSSGHVGMAPSVEDCEGSEDSAGDPLGRTVAGAFTCLDRRPVERHSYSSSRPGAPPDQRGQQYLVMAGSTLCAQ